jgi:prenyltransferase beta subunit
MGLMAAVELGMPLDEINGPIERYFAAHAGRNLADVYIAVASLDAAGIQTTKAKEWIAAFEASRNADGSFGKDMSDTAGAAVTILRLQGELADKDKVVELLRRAQRPDGGFGTAADRSDLATTYRVMRAFHMLKARPDVAGCRRFVQSCRTSDGGYGPTRGQPSTLATTYFACIILHWLGEMEAGS